MRFRLDQRLPGPVDLVERSLADPAWHEAVAAQAVTWCPELVAVDERGGRLVVEVRYRFRGQLAGPARRALDPAKLSWVQVAELDPATHRISLSVRPDHYADRLRFSGGALLEPDGDATHRTLLGEVKVKVPLVAGQVEGAVVSGLRDHAKVEEAVFVEYARSAR